MTELGILVDDDYWASVLPDGEVVLSDGPDVRGADCLLCRAEGARVAVIHGNLSRIPAAEELHADALVVLEGRLAVRGSRVELRFAARGEYDTEFFAGVAAVGAFDFGLMWVEPEVIAARRGEESVTVRMSFDEDAGIWRVSSTLDAPTPRN